MVFGGMSVSSTSQPYAWPGSQSHAAYIINVSENKTDCWEDRYLTLAYSMLSTIPNAQAGIPKVRDFLH